jgi:integrase
LLETGIVDVNPAARAKPPRLERESAHTAVFEENEIKAFLDAIKVDSLIGKRDKALFGVLLYTWARVSAVVALKVESYYERKGERWLRLSEKRGKIHDVPVTRRPGKPSTSGFSPPVLDLIPLLLFSRRLEKARKRLSSGIWTGRAFGSSCRLEPTPADSTNEYFVIPSDRQA